MSNYIKADLWRMERRLPRIIIIVLFNLVMGGVIIYTSTQDTWNSVFFMDRLLLGVKLAGILCAIIEFISVFSEDFRAKTMQIAIGGGMKRRHVILVKFADFMIAMAGDYILLSLVGIVLALITRVQPNGEQIVDYFITILGYLLSVAGYYSLSLIAVFYLQSVLMPMIVFLVLNCGFAHMLLEYLFKLEAVQPLNLNRFTLSYNADLFMSRLVLGSFKWSAFIAIVIYIAAGYLLSSILFKKKELEF